MCGFAGLLDLGRSTDEASLRTVADAMAATLAHRGPDDDGTWADAAAGVGLGFRRLSIVDLSPAGHQPMASADGRFRLVFNGEIYNFVALRRQLEKEGHRFRGRSDTEVLLMAIAVWGLRRALERCNGMFALALWDAAAGQLHLARDRLGEKPLYLTQAGEQVVFASELKALRAHPGLWPSIDRDALGAFLRYGYVPTPRSIYEGVIKLPPATVATWDGGCRTAGPTLTTYWSARDQASARHDVMDATDAADELDRLLRDAVALRMVADVPLGAFLSGGIDSSTVVALMQAQSPRPVRTFSMGFGEHAYDEAAHARAVAAHLGTDHHEMVVTPAQARDVIPELPQIYDEPFGDASAIPTLLMSRLARGQVTVALSGDGGDELFGGYERYFWARRLWQKVGTVPRTARLAASRALAVPSAARWDGMLAGARAVVGPRRWPEANGARMRRAADVLGAEGPERLYRDLISHWKDAERIATGASTVPTPYDEAARWESAEEFASKMMLTDALTYLPDDILVKVDRASMAASLEARVPLLDHRVVEYAWSLPLVHKMGPREGKLVLRDVLARYVPPVLTQRPKMGFGVPLDSWLRDPLREWAGDLLSEERLAKDGYLTPAPIVEMWQQHQRGERNWMYHLWDVLMFQAWLDDVQP